MNMYGTVVRSTRYSDDPIRDAAAATYFMLLWRIDEKKVMAVQLNEGGPSMIYEHEGAVLWLTLHAGTSWITVE